MLVCIASLIPLHAQPVTNSAVLVALDFDGDSETDATYEHIGAESGPGPYPYYDVGFFLRSSPQLRFVRSTSHTIPFSLNETISENSRVYVDSGDANYVSLLAYGAELVAFSDWHYYAPSPLARDQFYTNKTEVLIGFRFTSLETSTSHHGWLHFIRPNTEITTPFELVASDWNPLPNQPIRAGLPPEIPLQYELSAAGLYLNWPVQVSGWILETSETLGYDDAWVPVPNVNPTEVRLPPPEETRFFRLRRP